MLVPEVVWLSSASMRVVGGFIVFMSMLVGFAGVLGGIGICMGCVSIPGMSGIGRLSCLRIGWKTVANRATANRGAASVRGMMIPSLEDCVVAGSVE